MGLPTASRLQFPSVEMEHLRCLSCDLITHHHCTEMQRHLPTEKQAGVGWPKNYPIRIVLSFPNQGLFFLPCCLFSSVETFKSTKHSTWPISDSRIGLAISASSSSLLTSCLCASDRPSDPCYDFISLFAHFMLCHGHLCLKHNPAAPKGRCLPHRTCSTCSLLKRTNIPLKGNPPGTFHQSGDDEGL